MLNVWQETDRAIKERFLPVGIILELTRRCNLACCHCYNVKDGAELSFFQVEAIAKQLRRAGCLFLTLTGGEVLVREDFPEIAALMRSLSFDIKIITNGTLLTPATVDVLKELAPSEIGISLYGAGASTHDKITGVEGSFEKTLGALRALKKAGLRPHIKCTLMKENVHEHTDVERLAGAEGIFCMFDPVISPRDDGSREVLDHRLSPEDLEVFFKKEFSQAESLANEGEYACEAGRTFGSISAQGDVYPCIQLPIKVGNIFEEEFKEIWSSAPLLRRMREARRKDFRQCGHCSVASLCNSCPGLAYLEDGDLFGPSSMACFITRLQKELGDSREASP